MKFKNPLGKVDTASARKKITGALSGIRPFTLWVLALLLVFALSGVIVIFARRGKTPDFESPPQAQPQASQPEAPLVFMHPLLPPAQYAFPDDYRLFRPRRDRWTREEAQEWFTSPDGPMLEQLHEANTRIIDTLLEAAP
ncbi:MAG: hypothetical protein LBR23_03950 [Spirochaetaceae bacterium]|jgi:hypothetical protein|nr:hypothetical protein [Spirochaetaceae bacterium]